jgi:hypothetical protein
MAVELVIWATASGVISSPLARSSAAIASIMRPISAVVSVMVFSPSRGGVQSSVM